MNFIYLKFYNNYVNIINVKNRKHFTKKFLKNFFKKFLTNFRMDAIIKIQKRKRGKQNV